MSKTYRIECVIQEKRGTSTVHLFIPEYFRLFRDLMVRYPHPVLRHYGSRRHSFLFYRTEVISQSKLNEYRTQLNLFPTEGDYVQTSHGRISIA